MSGRGSGNGRRRQTGIRIEEHGGKTHFIGRSVVESIMEATGATEEDINVLLKECNGDVDEATSKLIDSPFTMVTSRKQKRRQRQEEESRSRKPGPSQAGASGSNGHGHGGRGPPPPRAANGSGGGHTGKAKPREGQRSASKGSRPTDRVPPAGHSGAGRKTPHQANGEYTDWGPPPDDDKAHAATNGAWGAPAPTPATPPTNQDRSFPNLDQEGKAPGGACGGQDAPKRTSMADIVRGASAQQPSAPVITPMVGIAPAVPVKTGYAAAAARALAPAQAPQPESRGRPEPSAAGPSDAPAPASGAPTESAAPPSEAKPRSLHEKPPPGFPVPHMLETTATGDQGAGPGDTTPDEPSVPSTAPTQAEPTTSQAVNEWDRSVVDATSQEEGGRIAADDSQAAAAPIPAAAPPDGGPNGEDYAEPPAAVVAPVADLADEFGYGETLRFGSFAGIEEFGGGITIPGEPTGPEGVVSLGAVQENQEEIDDAGYDAMQTVMERTLVQQQQQPPPVELAGAEAGAEAPAAQEAAEREEPAAPLASEAVLREQDQALEPEAVPASVDIDRSIVQEAGADMGTLAQPSALEKMVDAKADAATQVVEEPTAKVGTTYASTGVQHGSYAMPTPAVSMNPQSAEFKVEKGYSAGDYGEGEISDNSVQTNQTHAQYRVPVQDFKPADSYEPRTAPVPTVPVYQLGQAQVQPHGGHQAKHEHTPPPPPPPVMSGPPGPPPRYVAPPSTSAQTETGASSLPHPPPASGAPGMPMVRPMANPHMPQFPLANPAMIPNPAAMPYGPQYYPQYYPAQFHAGMYGAGYGPYGGGFSHSTESTAYPAGHVPPGGWPPKNMAQSYNPSVGGNAVNQGYQGNYAGTGMYAHLGNPGYEMNNTSGGYGGAKDKETAYIQPPVQHGYQAVSSNQLPRSDMAYYHQVPGQGYSQGFRNQHGFNYQYAGGGGYGGHPHTFNSVGVQGGTYGRHNLQ